MNLRIVVLLGGLMGGATTAQFPEYSQQYVQRLGGAVDALSEVVADFDASAQAEGLSRSDALDQMKGTPFLDRRHADMTRTFDRHQGLQDDLAVLQSVGPFMRLYHAARLTDRDVARAAYENFKPALPFSTEGMIFAGIGCILGMSLTQVLLNVVFWPIRRRRVT